jgi:hypothetical protein
MVETKRLMLRRTRCGSSLATVGRGAGESPRAKVPDELLSAPDRPQRPDSVPGTRTGKIWGQVI